MNKNERKYLYELIKKFLFFNTNFNYEQTVVGLSVLGTIQKCEKSKKEYQEEIKALEEKMGIKELEK